MDTCEQWSLSQSIPLNFLQNPIIEMILQLYCGGVCKCNFNPKKTPPEFYSTEIKTIYFTENAPFVERLKPVQPGSRKNTKYLKNTCPPNFEKIPRKTPVIVHYFNKVASDSIVFI